MVHKCGLCYGTGDCQACDGTGLEDGKIAAPSCEVCDGSGACHDCGGSGKIGDDDDG